MCKRKDIEKEIFKKLKWFAIYQKKKLWSLTHLIVDEDELFVYFWNILYRILFENWP